VHLKKIIIFCPYPIDQAPSQRFRFEQYLTQLKQKDFKITFLPLYNQSTWLSLYQKGNRIGKFINISGAFIRRVTKSCTALTGDFVFIHREMLPVGPPIMEWVISKVFRKKIIYDFDDAIWLTDNIHENRFEKILRWRGKVASICAWSYKVSVGNAYLADYAGRFSKNVVVIPTTIDTVSVHNPARFQKKTTAPGGANKIIIGWTGSHSTLKYLKDLEPVLQSVENKYPHVSFLVIADRAPDFTLKKLIFKKWTKESEIEDLIQADIGIMPLPDDEWAKGKCGFKALQYMALEIPCLASPVGVNTTIIQHGVNGFLCNTPAEWMKCFDALISNEPYRMQIGQQGRITVERTYSVRSNASAFLSLFR